MQEASSEREQPGRDVQPVSLYGFLDHVVSDEHKTRRLGYLMRQAGFVAVVVLISLAAVSYIGMYKAPPVMKAGVGGGSALFIMLGGIAVRIRRTARRRRVDDSVGAAIPHPLLPPPPEEGGGRISEDDRPDGQHSSDGNPHDDLGAADQA